MKQQVFAKNKKGRILTGDRPTGSMHLGHYVGSLKQRADLQNEYETYIIIADVQALTDNFDNPGKVRSNVREVFLGNLAAGVDPEKATFFIQSMVPQIAELTIFYANLVSVERLGHNPTVKTELKQKSFKKSTPLGFFMYPVSQAADITVVRADLVPVGEDQIPHIEQTAEIVKKFNKMYEEVFPIPKAKLTDVTRLVGTDGNSKMSKSIGNCIYLNDSSEILRDKVKSMYTDPNRVKATDPGKVEGNPVFIYHNTFNPDKEEVKDLEERYKKGRVGDVEVKDKLFKALDAFLEPMRERYSKYDAMGSKLDEMLLEGTKSTVEQAEKTLELVRSAMKINYKV